MDEKLEQLEAKVDQIGDKLDLLIRHLVPAGLPITRNTGKFFKFSIFLSYT